MWTGSIVSWVAPMTRVGVAILARSAVRSHPEVRPEDPNSLGPGMSV